MKKGTRKPRKKTRRKSTRRKSSTRRPSGARGNTKGARALAQVFSFITGTMTAQGAGAAANAGAEQFIKDDLGEGKPLHPAIDGAASTAGGAIITGLSAIPKPLRKYALAMLLGNATGGGARALVRWWMNREKQPAGAGRNARREIAEARRRREIANGAGENVRNTLAGRTVREQMAMRN